MIIVIAFIVNENQWQHNTLFWILTVGWFLGLGIFNLVKLAIRTRTMNNGKFAKQESFDMPDFKFDSGSGLEGIEKNKAVSHMEMVNRKLKGK